MPNDRVQAKVSVLLPTFNRADYIGAAIGSLLSQDHAPFEIIVLDDGSTDETASVCSGFGERVNYVRIARNGGKTAAINLGLTLARGEFVWIMDDDDIAPSHALSALLAPLLADEGIGFSFGDLQKFSVNETGGLVFEETPPRPSGPPSLFAHLMEDCFITGQPCTLFRRSCLAAFAPFDTSIVASVDYSILLQVARSYKGIDVEQVVLWQRQHDGLRGPAKVQYSVKARVDRWREFDRRLIEGLLGQLELHEYLGLFTMRRPLAPRQVRSALVQKAVIAGRKDLWDIAIESLREAVAIRRGKRFEPQDLETLSRMLGSRYGVDAMLADEGIQAALVNAAGRDRIGREVRMAIASLLTFWARHKLSRGDIPGMLDCIRAMVWIAGIRGAVVLMARVTARRARTIGLTNSAVRAMRSANYAAD